MDCCKRAEMPDCHDARHVPTDPPAEWGRTLSILADPGILCHRTDGDGAPIVRADAAHGIYRLRELRRPLAIFLLLFSLKLRNFRQRVRGRRSRPVATGTLQRTLPPCTADAFQ